MLLWAFFNVLLPLTPVALTFVALVRVRESGAAWPFGITWGRMLGDGILYFLTVVLALSLAANAIDAGIQAARNPVGSPLQPGVALGASIVAMVIFAAALLCYYFAIEDRHDPDAGDGGFHAVVSLILVIFAAGAAFWFRSLYHLW
jgi:hypothetical protein